MAKVSILDLPIYTWSPDKPGLPCVAFIGRPGQVPMHFTGKTPMRAHAAADDWRKKNAKRQVEPVAEEA